VCCETYLADHLTHNASLGDLLLVRRRLDKGRGKGFGVYAVGMHGSAHVEGLDTLSPEVLVTEEGLDDGGLQDEPCRLIVALTIPARSDAPVEPAPPWWQAASI
jgi:hypothetical protein